VPSPACPESCESLGSASKSRQFRSTDIPSVRVKNLFIRTRVSKPASDEARGIPELCEQLNALLEKAAYTEEDKTEMQLLLFKLGLTNDDDGRYAVLRQEQGRLLRRPQAGAIDIVASGRTSWTGGIELKPKPPDTWRWEVPFW
jgi:hypothetical protein